MTLLSTIAGVTGAVALVAGSPAASPAAPAASPVSVVACNYSSLRGNGALRAPGMGSLNLGSLLVTFVNDSPLTATDVRFTAHYANSTQTFEEAGTFSTGTSVTQNFTPSNNPEFNGSAACAVQSVTFSDGSTWQA